MRKACSVKNSEPAYNGMTGKRRREEKGLRRCINVFRAGKNKDVPLAAAEGMNTVQPVVLSGQNPVGWMKKAAGVKTVCIPSTEEIFIMRI